jgi:hypothetical protein
LNKFRGAEAKEMPASKFRALLSLALVGASCRVAITSDIRGVLLKYQLHGYSMVSQPPFQCPPGTREAVAARIGQVWPDLDFPPEKDWHAATPIMFCRNWRGESSGPPRETEVRLLWSPQFFYARIRAHYQDLFVYAETNIRRENLWQRDVAEIFLQTDTTRLKQYKEFEISPNGNWLDLAIAPEGASNLLCPVKTNTIIDQKRRVWIAQLAIPMHCLTERFDPRAIWRLNLFRIEGRAQSRFYSSWRPTNTSQPNFHVPEVFGTLTFSLD